ncbi:winged helix-turn-helix domain-containing protein (plasmid) [Mesorhizobium sp. ISC25]|uniref:ATP-binding protein n=1 Tax=Mesorhizobium sp. ISC25 TaxID=3077335 RepID=UPI0035DD9AB3
MPVEQPGSWNAARVLFGPFELNVSERSLKKADQVVPLGARAFDLLVTLVDRPGEIVAKDELIAKVWPDVIVEEGSLRVHLSALRKALGEGQFGRKYITNVQGRGYSFVAPVARQKDAHQKRNPPVRHSNLAAPLGEMVGRDQVVLEIRNRLRGGRLISILGAGGIGKTTVALAVGHAQSPDFSGAVFFVDLSVLRNKDQVVTAIASAMGFVAQPGDPEGSLLEVLRSRRALLILDSCEHLIEATAEIADRVCQTAPDICLLATSREALRIAGEHVLQLQPLDCPPEQAGQTADEILSYPAARLFMDRVSARGIDLSLGVDDAAFVAEICRALDGLPLAIELAARTAAAFGLRDTAARLASRLDLLKLGRRTAKPRHQTLRATLDWSHDLLSEGERDVLRRLAIFRGRFSLKAALAVAEQEGMDRSDVTDAVGNLVEKSLIVARIDSHGASYRLLDTTRAYALEKLTASDEHDATAARHANYVIKYLEANSALPDGTQHAKEFLGNVRAALEWSFGPGGNSELAVKLAAVAAPLLMAMSLLTECREWMARAVDRLDAATLGTRHELVIQSALASCLMFTGGLTDGSYSSWARSRLLAGGLGDAESELVALLVLWAHQIRLPNYAEATRLADDHGDMAERIGVRGAIATANYMRGVTYHHTGRLSEAESRFELSLNRDDEDSRRAMLDRFGYDRRVDALSVLANLKWLRGDPDHARRLNRTAIAEARQLDHAVPLCVALTWASFTTYLTDPDDAETVSLADELVEVAAKHRVESYLGFGLSMQGLCRMRQGETESPSRLLYAGLEKLSASRYGVFNWIFQAEFAGCLAATGRAQEGFVMFERAQIRLDGNEWYAPELHRIRGELARSNGEGLAAARGHFVRSLELSARQESQSWALRAATSLALAEGSVAEQEAAQWTLRATHAKFRTGLDTSDLRLAAQVLSGSYSLDHFTRAVR